MALAIKRVHYLPLDLSYVSTLPDMTYYTSSSAAAERPHCFVSVSSLQDIPDYTSLMFGTRCTKQNKYNFA